MADKSGLTNDAITWKESYESSVRIQFLGLASIKRWVCCLFYNVLSQADTWLVLWRTVTFSTWETIF